MKKSPDDITQQIRVLLADDHPVVRQGLAAILKSEKDMKVVAEDADGEETCYTRAYSSEEWFCVLTELGSKDRSSRGGG
jgi:DNA-binding NarL/FixJ family response regulator